MDNSGEEKLPKWVSECIEQGMPISLDEVDNPFVTKLASPNENIEQLSSTHIRWDFVKENLKKTQYEFLKSNKLNIWVGTWNVNGQDVGVSLRPWLQSGTTCHESKGGPPDLVFIGLQEMDRRAEAMVMSVRNKEAAWNSFVLDNLIQAFPNENYRIVTSRSMVGIYAAMFVRQEYSFAISNIDSTYAGCGLMGVMGNKGAVAIRAKVFDEYVCFVSSHLAPHKGAVSRRNQDYEYLSRRLLFTPSYPRPNLKSLAAEELISSWNEVERPATIWDSSILIWSGDLNYRINLPDLETKHLALTGEYQTLLTHDELSMEIKEGRAFQEFMEAPIKFPPSYKYFIGSSSFVDGQKPRPPAWTDRILVKKGNPYKIKSYFCSMSLKNSDHKPVGCFGPAKVHSIDQTKFESCLNTTLRKLDNLENDAIPVTMVSDNVLDYGEVVYNRAQMKPFELLNTGQTIAKFSFKSRPDRNEIGPSWIHVQPHHGYLIPGASVEVRVFLMVDSKTCRQMNQGLLEVSDILILHVHHGRDHFVAINGIFRKTPFCRTLNELDDKSVISTLHFEGKVEDFLVPKPVAILVNFLQEFGLASENLFLEAGDKEQLNIIQDCIDNDTDFPLSLQVEKGAMSVAEMIIRFLDSMVEPLFPLEYILEQSADSVIEGVGESHKVLLKYLGTFFVKILLPANKSLTLESICSIFGQVMVKPIDDTVSRNRDQVYVKRTKFLLEYCEYIK